MYIYDCLCRGTMRGWDMIVSTWAASISEPGRLVILSNYKYKKKHIYIGRNIPLFPL